MQIVVGHYGCSSVDVQAGTLLITIANDDDRASMGRTVPAR